jgi:RuvB-like protein 1
MGGGDGAGLAVEDGTIALLAQTGEVTSLRYAVQLLTPAAILARSRGRTSIGREDVEESRSLFFDAKASARIIAANADKYAA